MHDNLISQDGLKTMWRVFSFRLHYCPSVFSRIFQSKNKVLDSLLTLIPLVSLQTWKKTTYLNNLNKHSHRLYQDDLWTSYLGFQECAVALLVENFKIKSK